MFALPQMLSVPIFSSFDLGAVAWPTIGAVLAWLLIAALVGTALGMLREVAAGAQQSRRAATPAARPRAIGASRTASCEQAA